MTVVVMFVLVVMFLDCLSIGVAYFESALHKAEKNWSTMTADISAGDVVGRRSSVVFDSRQDGPTWRIF